MVPPAPKTFLQVTLFGSYLQDRTESLLGISRDPLWPAAYAGKNLFTAGFWEHEADYSRQHGLITLCHSLAISETCTAAQNHRGWRLATLLRASTHTAPLPVLGRQSVCAECCRFLQWHAVCVSDVDTLGHSPCGRTRTTQCVSGPQTGLTHAQRRDAVHCQVERVRQLALRPLHHAVLGQRGVTRVFKPVHLNLNILPADNRQWA